MPVFVDIIMLSLGKSQALMDVTNQTIQSLLSSEDPAAIQFNILVIESNRDLKPYQYPGSTTLYPNTDFGYHKFMNIGLARTGSEYVCLCNNDLIFHKNWASELIKAMEQDTELLSASPYDENFHMVEGFPKYAEPFEGYMGVLSGWCIFVKRRIFDIIGQLDERLVFWYCDADFCQSLIKHGVKNCLISSSFITHLGSSSLKTLNTRENEWLTRRPRLYYEYKWQHRSRLKYMRDLFAYKLHAILKK